MAWKTTFELYVAESCAGVDCGDGKKCVVRRGRPKCVCSPDCRKSRHKGPVCGTDGRSYRNVCRLRKRACRRKSATLAVAYYGHCQSKSTVAHCHISYSTTLTVSYYGHCQSKSTVAPCHINYSATLTVSYYGHCQSKSTVAPCHISYMLH
jgi:hypothetical protein